METSTKILVVEDQFVEANHLRLMLRNNGYTVTGIARTVDDAKQQIATEKPQLVLLDIFLSGKGTGIDLAKFLKGEDIPFIYISANSNEATLNAAKATQPQGFLVKPFREKDLLVSMEIARYHQEHGIESSIRKEALFQKQLKELVHKSGTWEERLIQVSKALQPLISFDLVVAVFQMDHEMTNKVYGFLRVGFDEYRILGMNEFQVASGLKQHEIKQLQDNTAIDDSIKLYAGSAFEKLCETANMKRLIADSFGMRTNLTLPVPLAISGTGKFFFSFFSRQPFIFNELDIALCERLQQPLIYTIESILANDLKASGQVPISTYAVPLSDNKTNIDFKEIIGKSPLLLTVFDYVIQVAPTDTSVLITGESGTGKESIAEKIHQLSPRKNGPFIRINCAVLPPNLIESELFGHEKGSFTGAIDTRTGKFEQAHKGTIFLDEIGEMPLDMQAKLLRVLQEKEIEKIGGKKPVKIDIRVVAATNRILEKEVAEGRFRLDLYYRLNVFPIHMPSLRDRKDDIILLTRSFLGLYNSSMKKRVASISDKALKSLLSYHWPGNIRELKNLMERSVLLATGSIIENIPLPASQGFQDNVLRKDSYNRTIEENEREHIVAVLNKCNGRIRGIGGAAEILGVPPTTLASKIKKLGIKKAFTDR